MSGLVRRDVRSCPAGMMRMMQQGPRPIQVLSNAAPHSAQIDHFHGRSQHFPSYYARPGQPFLPPASPPRVIPGPVFALHVPTQYVVHVQPPEAGLHPQAGAHGLVGAGTEIVLVLIVFVLVLGRVLIRLVHCAADTRGAPSTSEN